MAPTRPSRKAMCIPGADVLEQMAKEQQTLLLNPLETFEPRLRKMYESSRVSQDDCSLSAKLPEKPIEIGKDKDGVPVYISKYLDKGNYGAVFLGNWKEKDIIIKRIPIRKYAPIYACSEVAMIRQLTQLDAPGAVRYYFSNTSFDNCFYLGMEWMNVGSLTHFISRHPGRNHWKIKLGILEDCARALEFMHSKGMLHNDIKTANVLGLVPDEAGVFTWKLSDFGLSCTVEDSPKYQYMNGTPLWSAPELLEQISCNTKSSDMYSFGMLVWAVIDWTDKDPYSHIKPEIKDIEALKKRVNCFSGEESRQPIPGDTPPNIREILIRCWRNEADRRMKADEVLPILSKTPLDILIQESQKELKMRGRFFDAPTLIKATVANALMFYVAFIAMLPKEVADFTFTNQQARTMEDQRDALKAAFTLTLLVNMFGFWAAYLCECLGNQKEESPALSRRRSQ